MPLPFHLTVNGTRQGLISEKSCEMKGRENSILCYNIQHKVYVPTHIEKGSGERHHTPLTITKAYDRSSPLLYSALTTNEPLKEVKLEFYRINKLGNEEKFFEIKLKNALIVEIKNWMSTDFEKKTDPFSYMEDVSFTFETIMWEHKIESTMAEDIWKK